MDLRNICRILHPNPKEYTFLSISLETFFKIYLIFSHKANINRNKKCRTIICILSKPPCAKVRVQQHKLQKAYKIIETEQISTETLCQWKKKKVIKDVIEFKDNKFTAYTNSWEIIKVVLREKFISPNAYIKIWRNSTRVS